MSPVRSTVRNRALNVALVMSCASSMPLAGCLNSPFRSEITKEADRVTQQVELASAQEAEMDRLLDAGRVEFAGGVQPVDSTGIVQVNGEEAAAAKRSRWMFWKKSTPEASAPEKVQAKTEKIQDKIEKSDSVASRPNALAGSKSSTSRALATEPAPTANPIKDLSPENWFEKEFAASESRISGEKAKAAKQPVIDFDAKETVPAQQPTAVAKTPAKSPATTPAAASAAPSFAAAPGTTASEKTVPEKALPAKADATRSPLAESQGPAWAQRPFPEMVAAKPSPTVEKPQTVPSADSVKAPVVSKAAASGSPFDSPSWMSATPAGTPAQADTFQKELPAKESVGTGFVASSDRFEPSPTDDVSQRQQRLRVRALMSQAHSSEIRGELHSAYRSALLAEKIATEHQLKFSADEENPAEFARTISARIFKNSPSHQIAKAPQEAVGSFGEATREAASESFAFAAKPEVSPFQMPQAQAAQTAQSPIAQSQVSQPQLSQPEKTVASQTSSPFDSPFNERFATWVAAPTAPTVAKTVEPSSVKSTSIGEVASIPKTTSQRFKATTLGSSDALPEIRPGTASEGGSRGDLAANGTDPWSAFPAGQSTPTLTQTSATPSGFPAKELPTNAANLRNNVEFAVAEATRSVNEPRPFHGLEDTAQSRLLPEQSLASATIGRHRPMLEAPSVPAPPLELVQNQSTLQFDDPFADAAVADEEVKPATTASNKTLWIVIGLLGAGVATVFGLKRSRDRDEEEAHDTPSLEMPVAQSESSAADENVQFKIKRAA